MEVTSGSPEALVWAGGGESVRSHREGSEGRRLRGWSGPGSPRCSGWLGGYVLFPAALLTVLLCAWGHSRLPGVGSAWPQQTVCEAGGAGVPLRGAPRSGRR